MTTSSIAPPPAGQRGRRWRRRGKRAAIVVAAALIVFAFVFNVFAYPLAYCMIWADNGRAAPDPGQDEDPATLRTLGIDRQMRIEVGEPAVSLSVWVMEPRAASSRAASAATAPAHPRGTALVLAGIHDTKTHQVPIAEHFAQRGFRVVLVDLRGQGRSGGPWLTYGVKESRDLSGMLDRLEEQDLLQAPVVTVAESYGAATSIQLAAIDPRIRAGLAAASFTDVRHIVPHYVRGYLPGLGWLILNSSIQRSIDEAGRVADFDPDQASPLLAITRTRAPILLVHGTADHNILPWHGRALHAAAPDHSELVMVEGADHDSILRDEHWVRVAALADEWFDRYAPAVR